MCLASFTQCCIWEIHPRCCWVQQWIMAWCENARIYVSVLLLINIWVFLILDCNELSFSMNRQKRKTWCLRWEVVSAHKLPLQECLDTQVE